MSTYIKKWYELADVKEELAARDWFYGTSGNLSIKVTSNPLTYFVTASGKDKRKRTLEDFLLVDENGQKLEDTDLKPSAETLLHSEIYRKTNAGCVLHVHTVDNNVISEIYKGKGNVTFKGQEIIKAFGIWEEGATVSLPIIRNYAHIPTLAKEFSSWVYEDVGAVLIENHGITVWGKNAAEAKRHLEAWEFLFSYHLKFIQIRNSYAVSI